MGRTCRPYLVDGHRAVGENLSEAVALHVSSLKTRCRAADRGRDEPTALVADCGVLAAPCLDQRLVTGGPQVDELSEGPAPHHRQVARPDLGKLLVTHH